MSQSLLSHKWKYIVLLLLRGLFADCVFLINDLLPKMCCLVGMQQWNVDRDSVRKGGLITKDYQIPLGLNRQWCRDALKRQDW